MGRGERGPCKTISRSVSIPRTKCFLISQEFITRHFSQPLRRLAASDSLISSGGVSSYIQCVLVPEIAVMLVKQDMKIADDLGWEEKARTIMQESRAVGDELCEELEDRVENLDDRGEGNVVVL